VLTYGGARHGLIECSFVDDEQQFLAFHGSSGRLVLDTQAFTGGDDDASFVVDDAARTVRSDDPYQRMVETFASAVLGLAEWPRPAERSIEMLELIERIREATR
jgi:predicted dehydrogenase